MYLVRIPSEGRIRVFKIGDAELVFKPRGSRPYSFIEREPRAWHYAIGGFRGVCAIDHSEDAATEAARRLIRAVASREEGA